MHNIKNFNLVAALSSLTILSMASVIAMGAEKNPADFNAYLSDIDKLITIHKVGVLPATDNVKGLYARYVEKKLQTLVKDTHRFSFIEITNVDPLLTLADYESDPTLIKELGQKNSVDALIIENIVKKPDGLELTLDLFLVNDGNLFAQELLQNSSKFIVSDLEKQTDSLYSKILNKIPYRGLVLSRQGTRVTLDMGSKDGIRNDTVVNVEQVISLKRHPRFKFLIGTEKEILGKIKIVKADETLSFGIILQEKQKGVVGTDSKITNLDFVSYIEPSIQEDSLAPGPRKFLSKDAVSFGKNPKAWVPETKPSLGKINLALGVGSLHNNLTTQSNNFSSDVSAYPQLDLSGEIWLTPNWYGDALLSQGVFSINNPQGGSSPASLGANSTSYKLGVGYKYLFQDDFYGPQVNVHMGYGHYTFFIDSSSPISFASMAYSGVYAGVGGSFPVTEERTIYADVNLDKYLFSDLTETPVTNAATSSSSITSFSVGGTYRLTNQFWLSAHLNFDFFSASYSGSGTRPDPAVSANQNLITLLSGIEYLF
jgi:hypothetical protein